MKPTTEALISHNLRQFRRGVLWISIGFLLAYTVLLLLVLTPGAAKSSAAPAFSEVTK